MNTPEFTAEETEVLLDVLRRRIAELEIEISHTHSREFREMLRHRLQLLKSMAAKLAG